MTDQQRADTHQRAQESPRPRLPRETRILAASGFFVAVGFGLIAPALPAFAASFHVGVAAVSMVISAYSFLRLCFAPIGGRLIGRFGERAVYLSGLLAVALSTSACAFAQSYWQLLVVRALGGAGAATFHIAALSMLIRLAPKEIRGRAYALWQGSFLLGTVTGPLLGSLLMSVSLRLPFLSYGLLLLVASFVVWLPLRRSRLVMSSSEEPAVRVTELLRHPSYQASLLSNLCNGWIVHGVRVALIPLFVTVQLHRAHSVAGLGLSMFAAAYATVLLGSGRCADIWGRKPLALLGLCVSAAGTGWLGFTGSTGTFLAASLIAGLGAGLLHPAQGAAVADMIGSQASGGTVLAGFEMASDTGAIIGPAVTGALADAVSFRLAFAVTAGMAVLAMLAWARASETLARTAKRGRADIDYARR
jgi:MFS family permease